MRRAVERVATPPGRVRSRAVVSRSASAREQRVLRLGSAAGNRAVARMAAQQLAVSLAAELKGRIAGGATHGAHISTLVGAITPHTVEERFAAFDDLALRAEIASFSDEEDRVRVFSALLAGSPYFPGPAAAVYADLKRDGRAAEIDGPTNARFTEMTGITRPLDWADEVDRPLARLWLDLRDEQVRELLDADLAGELVTELLRELADADTATVLRRVRVRIEQADAGTRRRALADIGLTARLHEELGYDDFTAVLELLGRQAPSAKELAAAQVVKDAMVAAWEASNPGRPVCTEGDDPRECFQEQGGYILFDLLTGTVSTAREETLVMGLEGWQTLLRKDPDALDLKRNRTSVLVGIFHTHPETATPSDADTAATDAFKVPGFIVRPAGARHYGPDRRPTITGPRGGAGGG